MTIEACTCVYWTRYCWRLPLVVRVARVDAWRECKLLLSNALWFRGGGGVLLRGVWLPTDGLCWVLQPSRLDTCGSLGRSALQPSSLVDARSVSRPSGLWPRWSGRRRLAHCLEVLRFVRATNGVARRNDAIWGSTWRNVIRVWPVIQIVKHNIDCPLMFLHFCLI